jgi:hypothetical protein
LALLGAADAIFFCAPWKLFAGSIGSWWLDTQSGDDADGWHCPSDGGGATSVLMLSGKKG